jgi:signal transduction histidine kinase
MSIVNDLLDFSRFSSGRFSLDRTTVDIEPIVGEVVQNKRIAPNPPNVELNIQPEAKGAMLDGDPIRIQQVLDNLLSNAMKFTEAGGHIEVNVERHGGSLRVSVVDHGPGIPKCFQARVFDAFAQADSSAARRQGGVGLGLTICKSIVEAHGGSIGFMSNEGEGATFYFELPLATG